MNSESDYLNKFMAKLSYAHLKLAVDSFYSVDDVARQNGEYDDKCFVNKVSTLSRLVKLAQENVGLKNMPQDELFVAIADKKYSNEIDYSEKAQICEYVEELSRHITIKTPEDVKENHHKLVSVQQFLVLNSMEETPKKTDALSEYAKFIGGLGVAMSSKKERLERENDKVFRDVRLSEAKCDIFFTAQMANSGYSPEFLSVVMNETSKYIFENVAYAYYGSYVDETMPSEVLKNIADKKANDRGEAIKDHLRGKLNDKNDDLLNEQYKSFFADKNNVDILQKYCASIELHHEEELKPLRFITPQYKNNMAEAKELEKIKAHLFERKKEAMAAYKESAEKTKKLGDKESVSYKFDKNVNSKLISSLKAYQAN